MKNILMIAIIAIPVLVSGQTIISKKATPKRTCYTTEYLQKLKKQNPSIESTASFEAWMSQKLKLKRQDRTLNSVINYSPLPIIFHILHTGQGEGTGYNISASLVQAQVRQLNKDYANLSGSPYSVASITGLQFCLAAKDPAGRTLAQPGIDRVNTTGKSYGKPPYTSDNFDSKVKPATIWDPKKYINVWITDFDESEGILGYSTFPASSGLDGLDEAEDNTNAGIAIYYLSVGSIGSPSSACNSGNDYNMGRTLTHELGHFFGLRHIWGDEQCGNDYCDDTPVHTDANFGAPVHPKPNNCGTADEMFDNYMDYSDDKVMSTFTLNQAERMQIVMMNSSRRKELPNSGAGCSQLAAASNIGFSPCDGKLSVSEKSTLPTCPLYTDIPLYLNIEDKSTGNATLTISGSGTATKDVDYKIMNPVISITAGESYKILTIRIFDDAAKESKETILLSYTITGSGVSASTTLPQTFTLTILDDDNIKVDQNIITLLSEDFGNSGGSLPGGWRLQTTDNPNPKNKWVVSSNPGLGTGQSLHISNNTSTKAYAYSTSSASSHIAQTPLINATNVSNLSLSFKYKVAGEKDNDGIYDFGTVGTSPASQSDYITDIATVGSLVGTYNSTKDQTNVVTSSVTTTLPTALNGQSFYLNFYWENDDNTGYQPPLAIDDILLTGHNTFVETKAGNNKTINIAATDSNFLVSKQESKIIAAISNCSQTIDCLGSIVKLAGTGQENLSTESGSYLRSQKVIQLQPVNGPINASYSLTLYFTKEELAGWPDISSLKVMKVKDNILLTGVLAATDYVILNPAIDDRRATAGYAAFTISTTGFSQFFLVSANSLLPLQLITFNVAPAATGAAISWNIANEVAAKGYEVQRSTDGTSFEAIGFVTAHASGSAAVYNYTDQQLTDGIKYYYRINQVDLSGNLSFSGIKSLLLAGNNTSIKAYPNPTKNMVRVITGSNTASAVLYDITGRKIWSKPNQAVPASGFEISLKNLSAGPYMLLVSTPDGTKRISLVKE